VDDGAAAGGAGACWAAKEPIARQNSPAAKRAVLISTISLQQMWKNPAVLCEGRKIKGLRRLRVGNGTILRKGPKGREK
jgi:hypothetical protein